MNDVYLIEDNDDLRTSLWLFLTAEGFAVETFASAREFLERLTPERRGCVLTNLVMPAINGMQLASKTHKLRTSLPVIIITGDTSVALAVEAMKTPGVVDYIVKPFDPQTILAAIRTALSVPDDQREIAEVQSAREKLATLSPQQRVVLSGLMNGQQNKVIASYRGVSPRTVEAQRAEIMRKMGAKTLPQLIRMVLLAESR